MRFIIPINEVEGEGSQTLHIVDTGSDVARTNRKKLRQYFEAVGVPKNRVKHVMREMGFNKNIGRS